MPLYEYACRRCTTRFEQRLRYEERLLPQTCPGCGANETSLCLSAPAMVGVAANAGGPTCPSSGGPCGCGKYQA